MRRGMILVLLAASVMASPVFGEAILGPNDLLIAVDSDGLVSSSSYPAAEAPANILDGDPATKYLNRGAGGSGFIVTPAQAIMVQSFTIMSRIG